jgi:glycosyltransferase involved in cell wall biosynthesis
MQTDLFGASSSDTDSDSTAALIQQNGILEIEPSDRHLLIFELAYTGHYPSYLRHLAEHWIEQALPGKLTIIVSPKFVQHHADVTEIAERNGQAKSLSFVVITLEEEARLIPRTSSYRRALRSLQEWRLLQKYAKALGATQCLLLYFDSFQTAVATGAKLSCPFSGIYFRPTFHYCTFANYSPSLKERIQHLREKLILPRVLSHPQMKTLFCLDPYVIKPLEQQFRGKEKAVHLPDPVPIADFLRPLPQGFKESLGIEPNRKTFLLFGALYDGRKGIHQVLQAIALLPPHLCQQMCLLLVGQLGDGSTIPAQIAELTKKLPIQVVVRDAFVPESEVAHYFQAADVILATYQRHVGMSGILVQAAAAQKPLLSSDYGLMGEIVRRWQLGLSMDTTSPAEIARGLTQFLVEEPANCGDRMRMESFAMQHSAICFASTVFQNMV